MSEPSAGLPAWIEVRWTKPVEVGAVVLVFDTGLHRLLTLSQADGYTAKMRWGQAQPETVRDYRVECDVRGQWECFAEVKGNHQRRRAHSVATPWTVMAVRVVVTATNGLDHARLCEIRCYAGCNVPAGPEA
jgi:hypothetical protein